MWWTKTLWWSRPWRQSGIPGSNTVPWQTRWSPGSWSWSWSRRAWRAGDQAWSRGPLGIQLHWPMEKVCFAPHIPCSSGASVWGCWAEPAPKFSRLATEAHCSFGWGNREDGKKLQRDCWSARRMCLEAARQTTPRPVAGHCTLTNQSRPTKPQQPTTPWLSIPRGRPSRRPPRLWQDAPGPHHRRLPAVWAYLPAKCRQRRHRHQHQPRLIANQPPGHPPRNVARDGLIPQNE